MTISTSEKSQRTLQAWTQQQRYAEAMIPIIGELYREHGVIVTLFGNSLVNRSPLEIQELHRQIQEGIAALKTSKLGGGKRGLQRTVVCVTGLATGQAVEQVFPVELLTLRLAYERATGQPLSLDAPHPMLQGPLMKLPFPAVEPLFEDKWTRQLEALRLEVSAGRVAARAPIRAKYL